jgi:hypothetical protein
MSGLAQRRAEDSFSDGLDTTETQYDLFVISWGLIELLRSISVRMVVVQVDMDRHYKAVD